MQDYHGIVTRGKFEMPQEHTNFVDSRVEVNGLDERDCLEDDLTERIKLKSEQVRLATFKDWPRSAPVKPEDLARDGFYFLKKEDHVKCIFCNLVLKCWDKGDVVRTEHGKFNPNCPYLLHHQCGNVPIHKPPLARASSVQAQGVALFPEYSKPVTREETFRGVSINQNINELVEAGFFYNGHGDYVKCFHCGIIICHWEQSDDPFVEHVHWSPTCEYARNHQRQNEGLTPVMQRALEMGYELEFIQNAVRRRRRSGSEFSDLSQLVDDLERMRLEQQNVYGVCEVSTPSTSSGSAGACNSSVSSLEDENRQLKNRLLCKTCMEKNAEVTFLPCGHFIVCEACSKKVNKCPICRKSIRGYLKTFMS